MTDRARKVLEDAMALSTEERADLAAELVATLPEDELHPDWISEIERRARRAWQDPNGGAPWEMVRERLRARLPR
jgi:putative addiction module component (TIGR02574 family)